MSRIKQEWAPTLTLPRSLSFHSYHLLIHTDPSVTYTVNTQLFHFILLHRYYVHSHHHYQQDQQLQQHVDTFDIGPELMPRHLCLGICLNFHHHHNQQQQQKHPPLDTSDIGPGQNFSGSPARGVTRQKPIGHLASPSISTADHPHISYMILRK